MSDTAALRAAADEFLVRYGGDRFDRLFATASGTIVTDDTGREILDFTSGQMCATIGHNHPAIIEAMAEAGRTAIHMFSGMIPQPVARLGQKLAREWMPAPLSKSLIVNTGAESNEAALRIAKLVTGGYEVLALGGSWHGVTGGAAAASFASDRRGYGPPVPGVHAIPEPNAYRPAFAGATPEASALAGLAYGLAQYDMASRGAPAAIIVEPVISAGGVLVPPKAFFEALRQAADERGMLLIFDEAQTAFGRIGARTAAEHFGVTPDIMSVSKTLGGGLPVAATVTSPAIEEKAHARGFTFYTSHVADPLPALAGLAVLETIRSERLIERASEQGAYLRAQLEALQQRHEAIGNVRGLGLLLGVELVQDRHTKAPDHALGARTTARCLELGLSMNIRRRPERGAVWRIAPPLTVSRAEIDRAIAILDQALTECAATKD
ncbi:MAG: aspartate aminotransferase family protein [Rhodobiaceae bacterium]|nr:aspartate aminotransferase family protein [Rhodobiaceae bacterium]MCC0053588.1 aspartate aminotransferase family protein [Rhodobiaceae bacterium]